MLFLAAWVGGVGVTLAFTRYFFASNLYFVSPSSVYFPPPPAKPTLLQYYCTSIAQYTPPPTDIFCLCHTPYKYWCCRSAGSETDGEGRPNRPARDAARRLGARRCFFWLCGGGGVGCWPLQDIRLVTRINTIIRKHPPLFGHPPPPHPVLRPHHCAIQRFPPDHPVL